ncbi:hypothetical protein [Escherichia coli]
MLIQLNNYDKGKIHLKINQYAFCGSGVGEMRYEIDRYQDAEYLWIERQFYSAYKNNQVVIVNQYRFDADAENMKKPIDKYNVQLRFAEHYYNAVCETWGGFRPPGSSALGGYLIALSICTPTG